MKRVTKIFGVAAMLVFAVTAVGCDTDAKEAEKYEASNTIVKQNPEVKKAGVAPVTNETELIAVIAQAAVDSGKSMLGISASERAAAKTPEAAAKQVKTFVDKLCSQIDTAVENKKNEISFDGSINIEDINFEDAIQMIADEYNKNKDDDEEAITAADVTEKMNLSAEAVAAANDFVALDKLKLDLDLLVSDEKKKASIDESALVAASVGDFNKFFSAVTGVTMTSFPIRGITASVNESAAGSISGDDYSVVFTYKDENGNETSETVDLPTVKGLEVTLDAQVSVAVLTSKNTGGYFTAYIELNVTQDLLNQAYKLYQENADEDEYVKLMNKAMTVKLVVDDGKSSTAAFEKEYNYEAFSNLIEPVMTIITSKLKA